MAFEFPGFQVAAFGFACFQVAAFGFACFQEAAFYLVRGRFAMVQIVHIGRVPCAAP